MENPASKNVDPYQTSHDMAFDLGLHLLSMTLLRVSRYEWAKGQCVDRFELGSRSMHTLITFFMSGGMSDQILCSYALR